MQYREITQPKKLWNTINSDFEKVINLHGQYEMAKLTLCQLESYHPVTEWISAQDKIINDLSIYDNTIEDSRTIFFIMSNLPNTEEWQTFASTF
jgi:hypothetical protein